MTLWWYVNDPIDAKEMKNNNKTPRYGFHKKTKLVVYVNKRDMIRNYFLIAFYSIKMQPIN